MDIVVLDGYTENPGDLSWSGLEEFGAVTVYDRTPKELVRQRIGDAEAIYVNKVQVTRALMEDCPRLKFVGVLATGYNTVDVEAARELGITVCNIPAYGTDAVAQFTMALLLELCHHVGDHAESVKQGDWSKCEDFCYWKHPLTELSGKTMGIIGFGRIGQAVGKLAQAFGMRVLFYSTHEKPELETEHCRYAPLDRLYEESDVISLHCPLTKENQGMICRESIEQMKDGVFLINTARGPLMVEKDLKEALDSGKVGGAAVDVVSAEPIKEDNPLLTAKNMIITPHIAWAPLEARQRLMDIAVANLKAFLEGKPQNRVS